jgi:Domain of unknown function (DUF4249)
MRRVISSLTIAMLLCSCVDRIDITIPTTELPVVIDGLITDEPGPYTVQITRASTLDGFLKFRKFVSAKSVTLFDNVGNSEQMTEIESGVYQTKANGIRGVVGREYSLKIEMRDGKVYESIPDKMNPAGGVDKVYYEFETFQPIGNPTQYGFRIYADAQSAAGGNNLFRWKFRGTFEIDTYPLLHTVGLEGNPCVPDPRPCGNSSPNGDCTCCRCWVDVSENVPRVSDNQFVSNGIFKKIEIGYIPLEYFPFQIKYRVEAQQMSLSRVAFDYWRTIQSQKEGTSSLFQPPTGKLRSNFFERNGNSEIQGIFYAASVKKKQIYISNSDLPIEIEVDTWNCLEGLIAEDCRLAYPFSSTDKPADWQ